MAACNPRFDLDGPVRRGTVSIPCAGHEPYRPLANGRRRYGDRRKPHETVRGTFRPPHPYGVGGEIERGEWATRRNDWAGSIQLPW